VTNFIGQSFGRYHILEQLGEGGMAAVYKAYDTRLERDVAVRKGQAIHISSSVLTSIPLPLHNSAKTPFPSINLPLKLPS